MEAVSDQWIDDLERMIYDWDESKHPRDQQGRFAHTETNEGGQHFRTGQPVQFPYVRNTQSSTAHLPKGDNTFQQKIEPAGRYLSHDSAGSHLPPNPGWEKGTVKFNNPLVIRLTEDQDQTYGPNSWKAKLQAAYGGKTGKKLSQAVAKEGFDGIVTVDDYGTSEIVDLTHLHDRSNYSALQSMIQTAYDNQMQFRWVTIGADKSQPEGHQGGTPVQLDGSGVIQKGPPALQGHTPDKIGGPKEQQPKTGASTPDQVGQVLDNADKIKDWKQNGTRSQSFKSWFGDWESDPGNSSKVVNKETGEPQETNPIEGKASQVKDSDGKPVTVYHGTPRGGWGTFDKSKLADADSLLYGPGFYFTEDDYVAGTYADNYATPEPIPPSEFNPVMGEIEKLLPDGYKIRMTPRQSPSQGAKIEIFKEPAQRTRNNAQLAKESNDQPGHMAFTPEADWMYGMLNGMGESGDRIRELIKKLSPGKEVKQVYLNIRQPFDLDGSIDVADFKQRIAAVDTKQVAEHLKGWSDWNDNIPDMEDSIKFAIEELQTRVLTDNLSGSQAATAIYKEMAPWFGKSGINAMLAAMGYDGLKHTGGNIMGGGHEHQVWIAFEPNQIKSTDNQGTFDPSDDRMAYAAALELDEWIEQLEVRIYQADQPTDAQKSAGNYKMRLIPWQGFRIRIENEKGSTRSGVSKSGHKWSQTMKHAYGYIKGHQGVDGDQVDVFLGPDMDSELVFVVDQLNEKGRFDEHKVMIGFTNEQDARKGYLANYSRGWKCGPITALTIRQFKKLLPQFNKKKAGTAAKLEKIA